jgi:optic atrophy 3 protein
MRHSAIENGANALAEGFLFGVAALLIIAETWRSSRSSSKRRDLVDDTLEDLTTQVQELNAKLDAFTKDIGERYEETNQRWVPDAI